MASPSISQGRSRRGTACFLPDVPSRRAGSGEAAALTQRGQHVAELGAHDSAIALFVKDPQPLHKVLVGASVLVLGDVLEHRQERVKVHHLGVELCGEMVKHPALRGGWVAPWPSLTMRTCCLRQAPQRALHQFAIYQVLPQHQALESAGKCMTDMVLCGSYGQRHHRGCLAPLFSFGESVLPSTWLFFL